MYIGSLLVKKSWRYFINHSELIKSLKIKFVLSKVYYYNMLQEDRDCTTFFSASVQLAS